MPVPLGHGSWLEMHFDVNRGAYAAMLASVGIQPGWRVLDAGCGAGSHIPLLAEAVRPGGSVEAFDLDPDNIAALRIRAGSEDFCELSGACVADITSLPYEDGRFDAAWCANVTQYLDDIALEQALAELRRVTRSGGLVAVKDVDMRLTRLAPGDPELLPRLCRACELFASRPESCGSLRGTRLGALLATAGLEDVRQIVRMIDHRSPLAPAEAEFAQSWMGFLAGLPEVATLDEPDRLAWAALADPAEPSSPLNHPDFCLTECQVLAIGRAPCGQRG